MKRTIKLNEREFHNLISESVRRVIYENFGTMGGAMNQGMQAGMQGNMGQQNGQGQGNIIGQACNIILSAYHSNQYNTTPQQAQQAYNYYKQQFPQAIELDVPNGQSPEDVINEQIAQRIIQLGEKWVAVLKGIKQGTQCTILILK